MLSSHEKRSPLLLLLYPSTLKEEFRSSMWPWQLDRPYHGFRRHLDSVWESDDKSNKF